MAKGKKDATSGGASAFPTGPPPVFSKDHVERANFAIQASLFLEQLAPASSSSASSPSSSLRAQRDRKGKYKATEPPLAGDAGADFPRLARAELRAMKKWTEHNQVKRDPSLKRSICAACSTLLVPGLTSRIRVKPSKTHGNVTTVTCLACSAHSAIPAPPGVPPEDGVDGPVRAKCRAKMRRVRAPFHQREMVPPKAAEPAAAATAAAADGDVEMGDGAAPKAAPLETKPSGHTVWAGDKRVEGWGVAQTTTTS
ncbi:Ribonuclease P protein component 4 [Vanrija pseudolonga]|uniref:Ribonuclease P protein component 4 n=1 Tax=Vanrija pseudolonga TaxID=143232 RepID=A0AAF1BK90_9TREE|nr:Ribonuclease P protein component 4 [Vanrija pseudolonga]